MSKSKSRSNHNNQSKQREAKEPVYIRSTKNSSTKPHAPENASYQVTFGFWFDARLVDRVAKVFILIREGIK